MRRYSAVERGDARLVNGALPALCREVESAAVAVGLGGECRMAHGAGAVEGHAEGAVAGVLRLAQWLRSNFHYAHLGHTPAFLPAGHASRELSPDFNVR